MVRLARRPCFWPEITGSLLVAMVTLAAAYAMQRSTVFVAFALVIAVGALVNMLRLVRESRRGVPIVEIDRATLGYGESADVRVVARGSVDVRLVGECPTTSAVDISNYRDAHTAITRCYDEDLGRVTAPCTVRLSIPKSPPADGIAWKILVESDGVTHPFPLHVS